MLAGGGEKTTGHHVRGRRAAHRPGTVLVAALPPGAPPRPPDRCGQRLWMVSPGGSPGGTSVNAARVFLKSYAETAGEIRHKK